MITEGKHRFDFPDADDWHAFKYDETDLSKPSFYRERIGTIKYQYHDAGANDLHKGEGVRAVDIVAGIGPSFWELTLLEIKDFREDEAGLKAKVLTGEIPVQIVQKALHTWGALCLGARCKDDLLRPDLRAGILRPPEQLRVVFFLAQTPIRLSPHEGNMLQRLDMRKRQRLGILTKMLNHLRPLGIKAHLADIGDLPQNCGWTVTEVA